MAERSLAEEWETQAAAWLSWTEDDAYFRAFNWPAFVELLPPAGAATLDLGCGTGRTGAELRGRGHRLTGIDTAPTLVAQARRTGDYEDVRVADAAALPFAPESFDLVMAFMTLQDMDDAPAAVREAARVLRRGGRLVAAFVHPLASAHLGRAPAERRSYFDAARTADTVVHGERTFTFHQIHRSLEQWLALFTDAGLRLEAVREPRPGPEVVAAEPRVAKARELPAFLHVRAVRG